MPEADMHQTAADRRAPPALRERIASPVQRYLLAIVSVLLAGGGASLLSPLVDLAYGLVFILAVTVSARFGGYGPGVLASLLSVASVEFLLEPTGRIVLDVREDTAFLALFLVVALMVSQATASLQAARADAERKAEQLDRVKNLTAALSEAATVDRVAEAIVEEGMAALGAETGMIAALHEHTASLELLHVRGVEARLVDGWRRFPLDAPLPVADAVRTGTPVHLASAEQRDARYPEVVRRRGRPSPGALIAYPLTVEDRTLGGMAFTFVGNRTFSPDERAYLDALASKCSQALDRARLYDREHEMRERAEAASRAKSRFLAVVSHEFRTPLSAIFGYEGLLAEEVAGPLTDRQHQFVEQIGESARQLRGLIDEVLDFARIEAGQEQIRPEVFEFGTLVDDAVLLLTPTATREGLALRVEHRRDGTVRSDRAKVRQILLNLLSNALKFTEEGEVAVRVDTEPEEGRIVVHVRDTGPGIPPDALDRIFKPFVQADQSSTREVGGTGLGLAISRRWARMLGGDLTVESTLGEGSTFTLRLPLRARQPRPVVPARSGRA